MNCRQCKENMSAYLDGELDAALTEQVTQHARLCASCGHQLDELRRLVAAAAAMPRQKLPDDFLASVRAKIAQGSPDDKVSSSAHLSSVRPFLFSWLRELFLPEWNWQKIPAAAVVLVMVTAIVLVVIPRASQQPFEVAMAAKKLIGAELDSFTDSKRSSQEEKPQQKEHVAISQPAASSASLLKDKNNEAIAPSAPAAPVAKAELEHKALEKASGNAVAGGASYPPKILQQPASASPVISKAPSKELAFVGQSREERAKQQGSRIFLCATNEVTSAQGAAIKALDRCGGRLIDFTPALKPSDATVLRIEVPISNVQAFVQELGKYGEVTTPTLRQVQGVFYAEASRLSLTTPTGISGLTILEIQFKRPLVTKAGQAPAPSVTPSQPVQRKP